MKQQVNILVVDDRDENLMAVEAVLGDPGYRLVRARSGREALKEVLDQDFALILLDVVMPGVDGYETATLIRERPRSRQTPIIFLTANDWGSQHVFRGYTVGAVDYLVKPVPADVLRSKVAVFVELFNRQEALRLGQEQLEKTIAERTRELADANVALSAEIEERTKIERERVQLLRREQSARLEAERANRLKDEFLATLSHELRTPLNAIMGWAHVLGQSSHDRDTVQRAANVIKQNASSQSQLIDDILDVSRIVGGRLVLDTQLVELHAVIDDAIESLTPAASAKMIRITRNMDDAIKVIGDRDRLQQVVWNLISNALKFTPKGGSVEIGLADVDGDAQITVTDTGIGISAEFLPFVFDRFRQADSSMSRRHNGLGLGMAIVRHLVELHGGTVSVESSGENQGTTFRLRLARHTGPAPEVTVTPFRPAPQLTGEVELEHLTGVHVLIVEDDTDSRNVLSVLLQRLGAIVEAVSSAKEAYERVSNRPPDVMVSDIGMPEEDGYSLIRRVRQIGGNRKLPAIALTAYARKQDAEAAMSAGYDCHLPKPVAPVDLIRAIKSVTMQVTKNKEQTTNG
ncbi:MAG TPA: response regulator [Vicinamibacterales bacterium]|nr:response regulator [Vicinamibacterales bacterium]